MDVVLRFTPEAAEDAVGWVFHPTQSVVQEADDSVTVHFRAAGMHELCWHLFTWGTTVTGRSFVIPTFQRDYTRLTYLVGRAGDRDGRGMCQVDIHPFQEWLEHLRATQRFGRREHGPFIFGTLIANISAANLLRERPEIGEDVPQNPVPFHGNADLVAENAPGQHPADAAGPEFQARITPLEKFQLHGKPRLVRLVPRTEGVLPFAFATPSRWRSKSSPRSNSAIAASIVTISFPVGLRVSIF
jgi:hypothetical protein